MRRLFIAALLALVPLSLAAQTPSWKLAWDTTDALSVAQADQYFLQVNTGTPAPVTPVCVTQGSGSTCNVPLPTVKSGDTVKITVFNASGSAQAQTTVGQPATTPTNIRITIVISVP